MRRLSGHIILILAILFCIMQSGAAQQLPFVHYTPANGLVSNRARQLYQDKKGRLYITTYGGLSVFDGARFINYTTDNGLITGLVNDIVEMGDDSIWVIPNGPMIHCLAHGRLKNIETADHFYPVINQLIKAADGTYYAMADEGLFHFEKGRFVKIPLPGKTGLDEGQFLSQAVTLNRDIFILTDPHLDKFPGPGILLVYNIDTKKCRTVKPQPPFTFITLTPGKEIWLTSNAGIKKYDPEKDRLTPVSIPFPARFNPNYIYFDRHNNPWFSDNIIVCSLDPHANITRIFSAANGLSVGANISIFQDREGTMWFADEDAGITKLTDPDIQMVREPAPGFVTRIVYANPNSDSTWFFDPRNNDLLLIDSHRTSRFQCASRIQSLPVTLIMSPAPFLVTQHQIYRLTLLPGNRYAAQCVTADSISSYGNSIEDDHGNLIVISNKLVTVFSGHVGSRPLPAYVDQPVIDKNDRCWLITRNNQLLTAAITPSDSGYVLQPLETIDTKTLPRISPRSLAIDNEGKIYVGSRDHGLFRLRVKDHKLLDWKQWTVKDGLAGNFITTLLADPDNTIWAGTSSGLDQLTGNDRLTILNRTSSFQDYPFVLNIRPAGRNIHWAATRSGFLKVTAPQQRAAAAPPPVLLFSSILTGKRPVDPDQPINLDYHENNLHFYLATPSFINEGQIRFQYRLEGGANPEWSSPSTRSEINFDNLSPGRYRLSAKALFFGRYPDPEAHIDFNIQPPWWQTPTVKLTALTFTIIVLLLGVRAYTRRKLGKQRAQLEKQQAVEKERTRIAMDMHDDLGAGLTRIKFITEDMAQKPGYDAARTDLEKLRTSSNELVDKMGEIIWAMNEKNNTLEDLLFYLRGYAADYCQENGLQCEFLLPTAIPSHPISGQTRRNIFLILKETLHNIVKHAKAHKVLIEINTDAGLLLQVTDDGAGFDNDSPIAGNGLLNMEFRASAMNGTLKVIHRKPATVLLKIPL